MTDNLKQFIFNNLIKDLSNVEIIRHDESLWFIDREKKYWYLELVKTGKLYWRYQFFSEFFDMYSIDRDVYEPIIKEFVELVLNCDVSSTKTTMAVSSQMVFTVLNNDITSTAAAQGTGNKPLEDALNNGITSTIFHPFAEYEKVDSVLNNGITSSRPANKSLTIVDSVLNDGVTTKLRGGNATNQIESVLKNGAGNLIPLHAYRENMINYVLKDNPS